MSELIHQQVRRAVEIVGGQEKLSRLTGISQSEVSRLCTSAKSISAVRAVAIDRATNGEVSVRDLLPEVAEVMQERLPPCSGTRRKRAS